MSNNSDLVLKSGVKKIYRQFWRSYSIRHVIYAHTRAWTSWKFCHFKWDLYLKLKIRKISRPISANNVSFFVNGEKRWWLWQFTLINMIIFFFTVYENVPILSTASLQCFTNSIKLCHHFALPSMWSPNPIIDDTCT